MSVAPASDRHVVAATRLAVQLAGQLPDDLEVLVEGPRWSPLGEFTPSYAPDLTVVAQSTLDRLESQYQLRPPPLLVVEILSPATRRRDLTEKAENHYLGGAANYWTIELPGLGGLGGVDRPAVVIRERGPDGWKASGEARTGLIRWLPGEPFPHHTSIDFAQLCA